jgi:hypothetical protein
MSVENSSELIRNRTRDLPSCSVMPQPIALPRAPGRMYNMRRCGRKALWPHLGYYPALSARSEENHEICVSDIRCPGRDPNPVPPEYEALATRSGGFVIENREGNLETDPIDTTHGSAC